jgi:signal transduction histidine kinase
LAELTGSNDRWTLPWQPGLIFFKLLQRRDPAIIPGMIAAQAHEAEISNTIGIPMSRLLATLARLPKRWTIFFALVLATLVGWLDYVTGTELEVTAIYLIPIYWACWALGRKAGLLLALFSAGFTTAIDLTSGRVYAHPAIPYWNGVMLFTLFAAATYSMTAFLNAFRLLAEAQALLQDTNDHLEETVQQRTAALRSEISERQRLEQEKLKAERLLERQEKLATLGTLTAGIAHEIRNPLTSLKARLYTLEKHLHEMPAARKDADIISAEISRLERIVKDALSFARPADPKLETIAVGTLLREVHGLMATSLESRAVQLVVESDSGLFIRADSGHLKQVLINLIRNAAEAMDGAGTVTLRARTARLPLGGRDTEAVVLEVTDTGKGIPPEIEKRLFDPFFSTKETGTGLGLAVAARMVEKHGGRIEYQTRPGHGTTFGVVLPLAEQPSDKAAR